MMYYDRSISEDLLAAAKPGGPLGWLVPWVHAHSDARLDFRKAGGIRHLGGLQVYLGRTSPIEFIDVDPGRVKVTAHKKYQGLTPELFGTHDVRDLDSLRSTALEHLDTCRAVAAKSLVGGEAVTHNGLMRRYGDGFVSGDCFLAVDSEIRIGFRRDSSYAKGGDHRAAYQSEGAAAPGRSHTSSPLGKLDTVGILADGAVGLIEVKKKGGGLRSAAWQAEDHLYNFMKLAQVPGYDLGMVLNRMIDQKMELGLLPPETLRATSQPSLVPIIAAPDDDADWAARWEQVVRPVLQATTYLADLRFWRLSGTGTVLEEHKP